jgi:hypothetical protein
MLVLLEQVARVQRLEADEQTPQARRHGLLEQSGASTALTVAAACHSRPCRACRRTAQSRSACAEQVIVQKVEVRPGSRSISASAASTVCV